jgi:Methyltransferase small domain
MKSAWKQLEHGYFKPWIRRWTRPLRFLLPWHTASFAGICVHYKRDLDGGGRTFGQDFIPFLKARGMPQQGRCFEWCARPAFIAFSLLGHRLCASICLADVNPKAVEACRRTIAANRLDGRASVHLSDNLTHIPRSEQWDLVVSNPPHFADEFENEIRSYDRDWHIHRGLFAAVGAHLKPNGVIILQENNRGSTAETFREMIEAAGFSIVFVDGCAPERTSKHRFYFIGIMRRGDTPPP